MKFQKLLLTATLCTLLFTGCTSNKEAVVIVNDEAVTKKQYEEIMDKYKQAEQVKNAPEEQKKDGSPLMLFLRERAIQDLVAQTILDQQFEKHKVEVTNQEVEAKKEEIIEKLGSKDKYKELLKASNISDKQLREDLEKEIKINKLIEATANVETSDKEVEKFYNENKEKFRTPQRVKASHILIKVDRNEIKQAIINADKKGKMSAAEIDAKVEEEAKKRMALAQKIRKEALANPDKFAALAIKYSEDEGSAKQGGDLGFFTKEEMVKPFSDAAFSLKPDTISEIVVTQFGNHIVMVTDRAEAGVAQLSVISADLKEYLSRQKKVVALEKLFNGLKQSAKIE